MPSCISYHIRFYYFTYRLFDGTSFQSLFLAVRPFPVMIRVLWPLLTSHSSLLLRLMIPPVRPHGISCSAFLVYLPDLRPEVTVTFRTLLPFASSSAQNALVSDFFPSGHDFAIPSSRLNVAVQTLGVAIGFVGDYAPWDFHPSTAACPSYKERLSPFRRRAPCDHTTDLRAFRRASSRDGPLWQGTFRTPLPRLWW